MKVKFSFTGNQILFFHISLGAACKAEEEGKKTYSVCNAMATRQIGKTIPISKRRTYLQTVSSTTDLGSQTLVIQDFREGTLYFMVVHPSLQ